MSRFASGPARNQAKRGVCARWLAAAGALVLAGAAPGADSIFAEPTEIDRAGSGSISLGYHTSRAEGLNVTSSEFREIGEIRTHAAVLELEYYLTNRWSVEATIPFIKRRYRGTRPHNPATLTVPQPESRFLDDGEYHGGLQDYKLAVRYDAIQDSMLLRPFASVTIPSRDYTFFAQSPIGQNLYKGELGVELIKPIGLSDFYVRGIYAYEILERSYEAINTNHHLIHLELGWYAMPRLVARGFFLDRRGNGLSVDADFAGRTNERWYYHDQTQSHNSSIAGFGLDYALGDRHVLSVTGLHMTRGEAIHQLDYAASLELTWHFDRSH